MSGITLILGLLPYFSPFSGSSAPEAFDDMVFLKVEQDAADHVAAHHGTGFFEVGEAEVRDECMDCMLNGFGFAAPAGADPLESSLEFGIGGEQDAEEVFRPGPNIVFSLMPPLRGDVERLIIRFLGFLDDALQADVAAHLIALMVEREQREQTGHAAISIRKGVDAEEIQNVEGNQEQWVPDSFALGIGKMLVQDPHGIFREVRSDGLETNALGAVWQGFANFIGSNLPMAAIVSGIFEQISVELEHDAVGERNVGLILMDGIEHVAVSGDLALGAVSGFGSGGDEFAEALVIFRNDAFEAVGGFCALDLSDLAEVFEDLGCLLQM